MDDYGAVIPVRNWVLGLLALAVASAGAAWWALAPEPGPVLPTAVHAPTPRRSVPRSTPARRALDPVLASRAAAFEEFEPSEVTEPRDERGHAPHPITPQHLRNYRQTELLHDAWAAIKMHDFATGRQIVATHRTDYPGQWEDMNEGLEVVADCMQSPGPDTVARARRFYRERTASMMRKRIRRFCLEPHDEPPAR